MPRARLRYAIAIDDNLHRSGSGDPVVHVYGSRGGATQPFVVRRGWSGPQGAYVEEFRVVRSSDRLTMYRSGPRIVELAGEYYTNDVEDLVRGVELEVGDYELVFTIDNEPVPGVPVFVEPGPGAVGGAPVAVDPLIEETTKKSELVWLSYPGLEGQSARPAWHVWHKGAVYVVFDGSEQHMPGLDEADSAIVAVRSKDKWGLLVAWRAANELVPPGSPAWNEVVPLLVGKRLNNRDGDAAGDRWARECKVARLVPTGELVESPQDFDWSARSEAPAPSPATTETRVPMTLHGKSRRPADQSPERPFLRR
ncbi:MAG TPA: hypothetical protein VGX28_03715 [Frankiaceae bacterium]|jgi:hypothetical protein|nr:hypothetical protein [Frankiaceae bacterium]